MSLLSWVIGDEKEKWLLGSEKTPKNCEICWKRALGKPVTSSTACKRDTEEAAWLQHRMSRNRRLPEGTPFAVTLFYRTGGAFHPLETARRRVPWVVGAINSSSEAHVLEVAGRISLVVHVSPSDVNDLGPVWRGFHALRHKDKELIIIESFSDEPSSKLAQSAKHDFENLIVSVEARDGLHQDLAEQIGVLMASGSRVVPVSCKDLRTVGGLGLDVSQEYDTFSRTALMDEYYELIKLGEN